MTFLASLTPRDWLTLAVFAALFALCFVPLLKRKPNRKPSKLQQKMCAAWMTRYRISVSARQPDRRGNWTDRTE